MDNTRTVQFRDPSAPKKVEISLMTAAANVTVRGTQRNDVAVDWTGSLREARGRQEPPPGMHRLGGSGSLDVTQDSNNVVRISGARLMSGFGDVTVQVPAQASVTVSMALNGKVTVENIAGEIEVNHLNGDVTITNASGPVVAHSTNGKIVASLTKLAMGKAMSFSTFNGDIDVTLPADSKATLKARADNGDIFTDFDVKLEPRSATPSTPGTAALPAPPAPPLPSSSASSAAAGQRRHDRTASERRRAPPWKPLDKPPDRRPEPPRVCWATDWWRAPSTAAEPRCSSPPSTAVF